MNTDPKELNQLVKLQEQIATLTRERDEARLALADAADQIPCAGPVAHRIRKLKELHIAQIEAVVKERDRLSRELEAERAGSAVMREALEPFDLLQASPHYLAEETIPVKVSIGAASKIIAALSSTAGAEMLDRLRKAEAKPVVGNDLQKLALRERITTLEAALEEVRKGAKRQRRFIDEGIGQLIPEGKP